MDLGSFTGLHTISMTPKNERGLLESIRVKGPKDKGQNKRRHTRNDEEKNLGLNHNTESSCGSKIRKDLNFTVCSALLL